MAKKQDAYYFQTFVACMDYACQAARMLNRVMREFDPAQIESQLNEMHSFEHAADEKKHELLNVLAKAFITPIEREDIILLSQNIDEVTDKIEDVLLRLYCNNIQTIRPDALAMSEVVIACCEEGKQLLAEFADFKHSKRMHERIVHINTLEEDADQKFISGLRTLHTTCTDPLEIIVWREILLYLEQCVDACEHMADTVESVVMKNS